LGETGLFAGPRVGKDMPRVEVYGTIDELNCVIGLVRTESVGEVIEGVLERVQNELFQIGAELATPDPTARGTRWIGREHIRVLEVEIDRFDADIPPLAGFILPGGTRAAAFFHLARTVCRRAERRLVTLIRHSEESISLPLLAYLNRLGDLLFVLARVANAQAGRPDTLWRKPEGTGGG
jgi:cob(I)alamin adenosyltransferase